MYRRKEAHSIKCYGWKWERGMLHRWLVCSFGLLSDDNEIKDVNIIQILITSGWHSETDLSEEAASNHGHPTQTIWLWLGEGMFHQI